LDTVTTRRRPLRPNACDFRSVSVGGASAHLINRHEMRHLGSTVGIGGRHIGLDHSHDPGHAADLEVLADLERSRDVTPICLAAVSSGDDDAAAAVEVFRGCLQKERGHARA
jgi:hypothetical protein